MNPERIDPGMSAVSSVGGSTDDRAQRLSCLLDGELDEHECQGLIEALRDDEEGGHKWLLFNCVGDAMRSAEVASWHSDKFVARMSAALEREPTVLAPAALPSRSAARRWLLPGAGAVAAAVLIAVGLPSRQDVSPASMTAGMPAAPTPTVTSVQGPLQIDRSPQLERYLAAHRELAEPTLMPKSTPYVRTSGAMPLQEGR